MYDIDFNNDLAFGKKYEQYSLCRVGPYDNVEFPPEGVAFKDWDFKVHHKDGEVVCYEVKTDRRCIQTGNFFIETHNKYGNPSGLSTTKADVYILNKVDRNGNVIDDYHVPIELMNDFKKDNNFRRVNYPTGGFLLPQSHLEQIYRNSNRN